MNVNEEIINIKRSILTRKKSILLGLTIWTVIYFLGWLAVEFIQFYFKGSLLRYHDFSKAKD